MFMQARLIRENALKRLVAVAVLVSVFGSAGLVVAPAALAQRTGAAAPTALSPLQQAEKDTDTAATTAAADYRTYKDIQCGTGASASAGPGGDTKEAKKELKRANKELTYMISIEADAHSEVIEAQAAEESTKALLASTVDHPGNGPNESGTARKNHKKADKTLKVVQKDRENQIRNVRLASYAFGVPDPQCKVDPAAAAAAAAAKHSKKQPVAPAPSSQ